MMLILVSVVPIFGILFDNVGYTITLCNEYLYLGLFHVNVKGRVGGRPESEGPEMGRS